MGKTSQDRKNTPGYLRKLFQGRFTAQQLWQQTVMSRHRCKCGAVPVASASSFCPAADFERLFPRLAVQYAMENKGSIPIVKFRSSGSVRAFVALPEAYACAACLPEMEKMMARKPSYIVVEFHRGPGQDKPVSQVPLAAG